MQLTFFDDFARIAEKTCGVLWPFQMKETKWIRLLAYVTGLVNQELLLQNEVPTP
jgi:hypothetical protein